MDTQENIYEAEEVICHGCCYHNMKSIQVEATRYLSGLELRQPPAELAPMRQVGITDTVACYLCPLPESPYLRAGWREIRRESSLNIGSIKFTRLTALISRNGFESSALNFVQLTVPR